MVQKHPAPPFICLASPPLRLPRGASWRQMDQSESQYLFKETRLNFEPPASASIVTIRVPSSATGARGHRKPAIESSIEDETTFKRKNLATSSSIYHRQWHDTPRSFVWRVLEDDTVLSIRAADVCKKDKSVDAPLVLNFHFASPIQPGCVALSDPEEHDALCVFVLDQTYHLYTFMLRPDLFRKRSAIDANLSDLAKVQAPAGLGFKHPHRMMALSSESLLITVNDGGMIRLDKPAGDDPNGPWKESFFNVQGWAQNLRSLLPFQGKHTIKHGKINMEYSAATSVQITSFGIENSLYAITVCLDHRMRIWNLEDGQILYTGDILNAERSPQEMTKWTIDPSYSNVVQIVGRNRGQRICATYSPIGAGEFKFWKLRVKDTHTIIVEDLFPKMTLIPITPTSSDVWTLADFVLSSPAEGSINLWTLWKNNMTYRVQRLELDRENMAQTWEDGWDGLFVETTAEVVPSSGPYDPIDVTEKWLGLILRPGRFTKATLETALSIYERGLGAAQESSKGRGLAESICSVLGSTALLERNSAGAMDYEQFRASSETQWRRFYRLLIELDKQRGEALSLVLDPEADMVWVVCADLLSAVRECSNIERLYHNLNRPSEDSVTQAALLNSALTFVEAFPDNYLQLCNSVLRLELFEESSKTDLERIQYFSDKSGFWRGVTDDDCAQVAEVLGQNFGLVTDELYTDLFKQISTPLDARARNIKHPLTDFGRKLVIAAVQDSIELQWKVYFSQLILLVHMEFEFDSEEDALHNRVDVGSVFRQLVAALRRLELLRWLAKTEIIVPLYKQEKGASPVLTKKGIEETQTLTALETNISHLLGFANTTNEPLATSITDLITDLCSPDSDVEVSASLIQCALVKRERADLALELSPFCDQSPFSTYVQGRVLLGLNDFESAATNFRKAAVGMSTESVQTDRHSSGLLDDTEWNLLNNGSANYYSHIVALFERQRAYSYVADFARVALQLYRSQPHADGSKTDMLSRLFNAAVATSQFELAHTTLLSITNQALRVSSLRKMVDRMCETYHNTELVGLPFPGMQQDVEEILAQRCKSTMDVVHGAQYHQVLYAWRIKRRNYRGAAAVLLDRIQKLRLAGEGDRIVGDDVLDTPVTRQYLLLINALSCVEAKQAWIFDEGVSGVDHGSQPISKRKVVSLADIRKQYQDELDRIAAIQNNQFGFQVDDVMELA
ncbi:Nucleoporin NUP120 [Paramyrothecium foliicola]|nr:Nucleoporin NUP120 [Paramyrothecium foliicola]